MKKLLFLAVIALMALGCNTPTKTVSQPVLQTYKNDAYNFEFQYPPSMFPVTPPDQYPFLKNHLVEFIITTSDYPKTNFIDAPFSVSAAPAKSLSACLAMTPPERSDGFKTKVQINGVDFYMTKGLGAAAGNLSTSTVYRTLRGQNCLELSETIHIGALPNYPAGTTEVNSGEVQSRLDTVLNSFKFN